MSRPIVATCVRGLALLLVGVAWHGASAEEVAAVASGWRGPADAFVKDAKGRITGSWWQGGAVGVAHFTGPGAPNLPAVDKVCHAVAEAHGMPCVEIHRDDVNEFARRVNEHRRQLGQA